MPQLRDQLVFRVTPQQRDGIASLSRQCNLTPSKFMRAVCKVMIGQKHCHVQLGAAPSDDFDECTKVIAAVAKALGLDPKTATNAEVVDLLQSTIAAIEGHNSEASQESADPVPAIDPVTGQVKASAGKCGRPHGSRGCSGACGGNQCTALSRGELAPDPHEKGLSPAQRQRYRALRAQKA